MSGRNFQNMFSKRLYKDKKEDKVRATAQCDREAAPPAKSQKVDASPEKEKVANTVQEFQEAPGEPRLTKVSFEEAMDLSINFGPDGGVTLKGVPSCMKSP